MVVGARRAGLSISETADLLGGKIGQYKIGKMLPGLMSLDFCCNIQMVASEFGVKSMKAWIYPALYQRFRLVLVHT